MDIKTKQEGETMPVKNYDLWKLSGPQEPKYIGWCKYCGGAIYEDYELEHDECAELYGEMGENDAI